MKGLQKNAPALSVYVAPISEKITVAPLGVPLRDEEIAAVGSEQLRVQKYSAFRLLERALRDHLGLALSDVCFTRTKEGKWETDGFFFSLSHTERAVAVALSNQPVGVDLESHAALSHVGVVERHLTDAERELLFACPDASRPQLLLEAWCRKEALFKKRGEGGFRPEIIDSADACVESKTVPLAGEEYLLAVASDTPLSAVEIRFETL